MSNVREGPLAHEQNEKSLQHSLLDAPKIWVFVRLESCADLFGCVAAPLIAPVCRPLGPRLAQADACSAYACDRRRSQKQKKSDFHA